MARLVIKNGFIKGDNSKTAAHRSYLVKYIATRDGVEKIRNGHEHWHSTKSQQALIAKLVREFPDSKNSLEYEDYLAAPNRENGSEFISITLEQHIDLIGDNEKYLDYIANRPRVEKLDTHGLFSSGDEPLVLAQVSEEVADHTGNVWTPIISLRREDAEIFGFESAAAWQALLKAKAVELAADFKIHPDRFKWYAAFHNEAHHPHIHMICYSTDPAEGYLTTTGIRKMKSALAAEIFRQELTPLYQEKTLRRDALKAQAATAMRELVLQMQGGVMQNDKIEQLIAHLAERLQFTTGKKQYGYLKADLKNVVDAIVDELANDERVAAAYLAWQQSKGLIDSFYSENQPEQLPLSKCEEFKPIRNMVITEAMHIVNGTLTLEEPVAMDTALYAVEESESPAPDPLHENAPDADADPAANAETKSALSHRRGSSHSWWSAEYKKAKQYLYGDSAAGISQDFEKAHELLLTETEKENPLAMYDLGRMTADGLGCEPNTEVAHAWYEQALSGFHAAEKEKPWKYTQYRIGKMYAAGLGTEQDYMQAADWLSSSAAEKYMYAEYSLAGLYARGNGVEQNQKIAFDLYTRAAEQGFPYASFELGKMLRDGIGCEKNSENSDRHFAAAFVGFKGLERQSHDDKLQYRLGWVLLNGIGTEKDISQAKSYLEQAATVGNPFAAYQLAKLILSGEDIAPQDMEQALAYLKQAAAAENPHAQYALAKLYDKGQSVPQNTAEALRLYTLSARQGNEYAAYRLGRLYLGGEGVLKDVDAALHWLHFAAEKKNQFAEYALGVLYLKGEDTPKNAEKAIAFFRSAAEQGNEFAQYRLGKIYLTGEDTPKDIETALRYLNDAAAQGSQYAQYLLGKFYLLGNDVPRERDIAAKWFHLSAAQGNLYAQFFLEHINDFKDPSVMLAATRLLHHVSRIFEDNTPPLKPQGHQTDRKLLRKIREKKQAQGHARNDHEQTMSY